MLVVQASAHALLRAALALLGTMARSQAEAAEAAAAAEEEEEEEKEEEEVQAAMMG